MMNPRMQEIVAALSRVRGVEVAEREPLSRRTRFGIGGPARVFVESREEAGFLEALRVARSSGRPVGVIGEGTNLVASEDGFPGILLRFRGDCIQADGRSLRAEAGASLHSAVDCAIARGLAGLETLAGIPGSVGAAVYGNAGAYGHSLSERVRQVRLFDGDEVRALDQAGCRFRYRESIFKQRKGWTILSVELELEPASRQTLRAAADSILEIRNRKYPPEMKCAGSIFKNLLVDELPASLREAIPPQVVREGKAPAAWFLERAGAKGLSRGDMRVADYHANLIYNAGAGTARELVELIGELKARVLGRFGLLLEEEIQYVGFPGKDLL